MDVHDFKLDVTLLKFCSQVDLRLMEQARQHGCPHCQGSLHQASYGRAVRGVSGSEQPTMATRYSLCCSREGCRRRLQPRSCIFLGRRLYWLALILVSAAVKQTSRRAALDLSELVGIDVRTLQRWCAYFREEWPRSGWWQTLRGRLSAAVANQELPAGLLAHFIQVRGNAQKGLAACLVFLAGAPRQQP
jgi:hypothetical protein